MENFELIETEFINIENEDNDRFIEFHNKYSDTFDKIDFLDKEITIKKIWMLSEISEAYYQKGNIKQGKFLTRLAINLFDKYSMKFDYSLKEDDNYRNLMLDIAGRHFKKKNFFRALKYYSKLSDWEKYKNEIQDFIRVSKFNFIKQTNNIFGLLGALMIVINWLIRYTTGNSKFANILGLFGGIILITFGIIDYFNKKANR